MQPILAPTNTKDMFHTVEDILKPTEARERFRKHFLTYVAAITPLAIKNIALIQELPVPLLRMRARNGLNCGIVGISYLGIKVSPALP